LTNCGALSRSRCKAPIGDALLRNGGNQLGTAQRSTDRRHAATPMRSATRSFALRLRGLRATSSSDAVSGLSVINRSEGVSPHPQSGTFGGQMQPRAAAANARLTIRSSRE
jgi:hypothetical protein